MVYSQQWLKILDIVDNFMLQSPETVWFRGHSEQDYPLQAGLFRLKLPVLQDYLNLEYKIYTYYKNIGHLLHHSVDSWQILYSLQHHGGKTRLLDWTESFGVAVYFALSTWQSGSSCIWLLNPYGLNYLSVGIREIISPAQEKMPYPDYYFATERTSLAIYPVKNTNRIGTQHGTFTVQGNGLQALDTEFDGQLLADGYLKRIELPEAVRPDAWRFVKQCGINHFALFPDLDGLAEYLNDTLVYPKNKEPETGVPGSF